MKVFAPLVFLTAFWTFSRAQNVGIGTTIPSERLEVAGKVKATGLNVTTNAAANRIMVSDSFGNADWKVATPATTNAWGLTGNTNIDTSNFIGTTGAAPLQFKVENQRAGIINDSVTYIGFRAGRQYRNDAAPKMYRNTALGTRALESDTGGHDNVAIGDSALQNLKYGFANVAVGSSAGRSATQGTHNTAVGYRTGCSGTASTTLGSMALQYGYFSVAVGYRASRDGGQMGSVAIGAYAMDSTGSSSGSYSCAIGMSSLAGNKGDYCVGLGAYTLLSNKADYNIAIGHFALEENQQGDSCIAIGANALHENSTGRRNIAIGTGALQKQTNGSFNIGIGTLATSNRTGGNWNTATGQQAFQYGTGGDYNAAYGYQAMGLSSASVYNNSAFGAQALYFVRNSATANAALGTAALFNAEEGDANTGLGAFSDVAYSNLYNTTSVGNGAVATSSNRVRIGNSQVTSIAGTVSYGVASDARFKTHIDSTAVRGLSFIRRLRPVNYQLDTRKLDAHIMQAFRDTVREARMRNRDYTESSAVVHTGFLAQEVEVAAREAGYVFDGVTPPANPADHYTVSYSQFVVPLVKAVQELEGMVKAQQVEIEALKAHLEKQR